MQRLRVLSQEAANTRGATPLVDPRRMRTGQAAISLSDAVTPTPFWHHSGTAARISPNRHSTKTPPTLCYKTLPTGGLEPPHPCGLRILSPLRLPFRQAGQVSAY